VNVLYKHVLSETVARLLNGCDRPLARVQVFVNCYPHNSASFVNVRQRYGNRCSSKQLYVL
ncbi:MAG: hypothetical protein MK009_08920, partial [Gammaproteobacteria bacterium]|nr:hypothetical protein [Gammaproteobacteria bacterium]